MYIQRSDGRHFTTTLVTLLNVMLCNRQGLKDQALPHPVFMLSRERGRWNGDLRVAVLLSYLRNVPILSEPTWIL